MILQKEDKRIKRMLTFDLGLQAEIDGEEYSEVSRCHRKAEKS